MSTERDCPVCKGLGVLPTPRTSAKELAETDRKHGMVAVLVGAGYSYREVANLLGYKSPSTVGHIVKKHDRKKSL